MSLASTPDAPAPLLCLYGDASRSGASPDLPSGLEVVECETGDAHAALRDARCAGRDVILLALGQVVAPVALVRLERAARVTA